ncbi:hypothetical protein PLICRDRAFT_174331 [Plicaturopsis crispa FD-325 SS-3]|nr:hypothetical protein PLICRDRAFT_174331 [Plicaturopsis crispa FD-325 SS-3]
MNSTPSTPKPPPFRARTTLLPIFSPAPTTTAADGSEIVVPSGMELIIRGVYDPSKTTLADPVPTVEGVITRLSASIKDLSVIPVEVRPYSSRDRGTSAPTSTSCYVRLPCSPSPDEEEPRCDLLEVWLHALRNDQPTWEVAWSPTTTGKDKRSWVRFTNLFKPDELPASAQGRRVEISPAILDKVKKICSYLDGKGLHVADSYVNAGGAVLSMANPSHVDQICDQRELKISSVSDSPLIVARGRQIEICNAFEIIINGINSYDGIDSPILCWIASLFPPDSQHIVTYRFPPGDPDALIFHMCDWQSTARVLRSGTAFEDAFGKRWANLTPPQLLWTCNSKGIYRKDNYRMINTGGQELAKGLNGITESLKELRRDVAATTARVGNIETAMTKMVSSIEGIQEAEARNHRALIVLNNTQQLNSMLNHVSMDLMAARRDLKDADTAEEVRECKEQIALLRDQEAKLRLEVRASDTGFSAMLGGTTGDIVGAPPRRTIANAVPSTTAPPIASGFTDTPAHMSPTTSTPASPSCEPSRDASTYVLPRPQIPAPPMGLFGKALAATHDPTSPTPTSRHKHSSGERDDQSQFEGQTPAKRVRTSTSRPADASRNKVIDHDQLMRSPDGAVDNVSLQFCSFPSSSLSATRDASPARSLTPTMQHEYHKPHRKSGCSCYLVVGNIREAVGSITSRVFSCPFSRPRCVRLVQHISKPPPSLNSKSILMIALCFLFFANLTSALPTQAHAAPVSVYALNANGLISPGTVHHVNTAINARKPHVFVLTETKTDSKLSSTLPNCEYNIFEEPGVRQTNSRFFKWGVVVGIRKDLQISQRVVTTKASLRGRIIVIDVVLTSSSGQGFRHRFIGAYAPWNPGDSNETRSFWSDVTQLCRATTTSWTLSGDLNATVSALERSSGGLDARSQFLQFLEHANALDLWSLDADRDRSRSWTCRARGASTGGSIIDRVVTSKATVLDSEIGVADGYNDWIPFTDHRAIVARLNYQAPATSRTALPMTEPANAPSQWTTEPRIKYPCKAEKARFDVFRENVDKKIRAEPSLRHPVIDDASFLSRYNMLTHIIVSSAEDSFGRNKRFTKSHKSILTPKISGLIASVRNVSGAIRIAKSIGHQDIRVSFASQCAYVDYAKQYQEDTSLSDCVSLIDYLHQRQKMLRKELFAAKLAQINARARKRNQFLISSSFICKKGKCSRNSQVSQRSQQLSVSAHF